VGAEANQRHVLAPAPAGELADVEFAPHRAHAGRPRVAAAAMTARLRLPDVEEKDRPKRRPIPDHVPRMEVELGPGADACADCGGRLRRIGEDVTEEYP